MVSFVNIIVTNKVTYLLITYLCTNDFYFLDIAANLTDPMYKGIYNGNKKHREDLEDVLDRSWKNDLKKIIITSGSLDDSVEALKITSLNGRYFNYIQLLFNTFLTIKILQKIFIAPLAVIQHGVMNLIKLRVLKRI